MKISVDGVVARSVDLYGPGKSPAQLVFRSAPLPYGRHTIKVECTGEKNKWAKGGYAVIDAFRVIDPVIDDTSQWIAYHGTWTHADASEPWTGGDLNRTESFSRTAGDTASTTFRGTGIRVICPRGPNQGIAEISVDGGPAVRVDLYAGTKQYQQKVYERTGLTDGEHTVTVKVTGDRNTAAMDPYVTLDAFEALEADPYEPTSGVDLIVSARINYPDLAWGNHTDSPITLEPGRSATARIRLLA
ncbi:hypothetical protein L1085_001430 [Streptomyces sp. MSC1_001]|uniref:hypothetical protein n=1 Tax=Streptomyces sp. MSC1_001 TaxID=2909263 RepID=UPI00202FBCDF|nr:hypothetical protein [Streptomyces sp. MSC1_001]